MDVVKHYSPAARRALLIAPPVVVLAMFGVFQIATILLGVELGRMAGYIVYWLVCGVTIPVLVVGRHGIVDFLRRTPRLRALTGWMVAALLAVPPIVGFLFVFPTLFPTSGERIIFAVAVYAIVNGTLEEVFWRGLFARAFAHDAVRGFVYPAVMFALWQLVPLSLYPTWRPIDTLAVFGAGLFLGMLYGWLAWRTGTIRWTVLSHVLTNLAGLGAFLVFRPNP